MTPHQFSLFAFELQENLYTTVPIKDKLGDNLPQKDLVFHRKALTDRRGQTRISLPKVIAEALGRDLALVWRDGRVVLLPWAEVDA